MLVFIGIILLLAWLIDHAVHLTAGSLIDLLLIFAAISFALDILRPPRSERTPNWDHRPPRPPDAGGKPNAGTWLRARVRNLRNLSQRQSLRTREQS